MKIITTTVFLTAPLGIIAQSPNNEAASITKNGLCSGFVPTPDGGIGFHLFTDLRSQSVITPSGNLNLICDFNIPKDQRPSTATYANGFSCGTYLGGTTDSTMVATPGGKAILTCEIKHA